MNTEKDTEKQGNPPKKWGGVYILLVTVLIVAIVVGCILHRKRVIHLAFLDGIIPQESPYGFEVKTIGGAFDDSDIRKIGRRDLSVHFLELGNSYTGDCTLVKTGDTEVLIDAGTRRESAKTIKAYLDNYCTDGVLEYVVVTHAHQDHISAFFGETEGEERTGIFYQYEIETLIQFSKTDKVAIKADGSTSLYGYYLEGVEYLKERGTNVYTALECWQGGDNTDGARRMFVLNEKKDITMNILYHKYYEEQATEENDYSVCTLFSQEDDHYLFTGDLAAQGEASLIECNDLPKVRLFKAGHHGARAQNTPALLKVIQPQVVCVSCCCGSDEYNLSTKNVFPSQTFTDNVAPYTDHIYVTSMAADNAQGYTSMNGTIVVYKKWGRLRVHCSSNATKFKDTAWFAQYRTWKGL